MADELTVPEAWAKLVPIVEVAITAANRTLLEEPDGTIRGQNAHLARAVIRALYEAGYKFTQPEAQIIEASDRAPK